MTSPNNRSYFAYGSNMDVKQMSHRCPGATLVGPARMPGHKFVINSRGVATMVTDNSRAVHGILWRITESDEKSLDEYEGVRWGTYVKVTTTVETSKSDSVSALVYVARDNTEGASRPGYLERIVAAAQFHSLPEAYVEELRTWLGKGSPA